MKNLHSKLSISASFIFLPLLWILRSRRNFAYVFSLLVLMSLSSCYLHFYKTNTTNSIDASKFDRIQSGKYFIIHFPNAIKGLEQISLKGDTLHGKIMDLPADHSKYLYPVSSEKNQVKRTDRSAALREVHLYTNDSLTNGDVSYSASLTSFNRSDVYELNRSATKKNHILSTVGVVATSLAAAAGVAFVVLLIACNCPQVYVNHNDGYQFASGLYSGAVYAPLERTDYLPLSGLPAETKNISFKIANAKNEEQFINTAELIQVVHSRSVRVLPDRHGNVFSYGDAFLPLSAITENKTDITTAIIKQDREYYSFDNKANQNGLSDLVLQFNKPENTNKAKLIIRARNTYWGGLLYKEFIHLFGDSFEKWREKQDKADPKKLEKWQTDQGLPLMVYLKTAGGWKFIDYFPLIGNTATRDLIMEINTDEISQDKIELKLETVYKFWDVDYAALDFSANEKLKITAIEPDEAVTSDSIDQKSNLAGNDEKYTHLRDEGESIYFKYTVETPDTTYRSSYILASGGYYHNLEKITGKTNYAELYKFKKKGAFDKFSREKHRQVQEIAEVMNGKNKIE